MVSVESGSSLIEAQGRIGELGQNVSGGRAGRGERKGARGRDGHVRKYARRPEDTQGLAERQLCSCGGLSCTSIAGLIEKARAALTHRQRRWLLTLHGLSTPGKILFSLLQS